MVLKTSLLNEEYSVEFYQVPPESRWWGLVSQVVTFPKTFIKALYGTYLLIRHKELREPMAQSHCPMKWINKFSSFVYSTQFTSNATFMKALLKHPRKDPENGIFNDVITAELFLPLLRDLYPSETITFDDFFLTAHKNVINQYRQPVLQFIGVQNIKKHAIELEQIVKETVKTWGEKSQVGKMSATELSLIFTTSMISKLLLGHPGPSATYRDIAVAIDCLNKSSIKQVVWKRSLSNEEKENYNKSLEVVRQAIHTSLMNLEKPPFGSFLDNLRQEKGMSELRIKTTLFMMYLGGSETTSSLLSYLLWLLGQHPEYQEEIFEEVKTKTGTLYEIAHSLTTIDKLFAEALRLFTPVYVFGRYPTTDFICVVKDKEGKEVCREKILKKEGIVYTPTFAARDPQQFEDPDVFNPHRFKTTLKSFSWLPFGDGKHSCPGQWLAKAEVVLLITELVQHYRIQSFPDKKIKQSGDLTLKSEEVWMSLSSRR